MVSDMPLSRREFAACVGVAAARPERPNIVLFLCDDHGWNLAGCYGNPVVRTPNLDALAREGMRFTRAFTASPTCSPSRAILYTGLHSPRNGAMDNHSACKPGLRSITHYLQALGYRTVLANKLHVSPPEVFGFEYVKATLPPVPGRKRYYRDEGLDTAVVDRLLAEHARNRSRQPLCLILGENGPHVVWEQNRIYDPAKLPLPPIAVDTPATRAAMANYYQDITSTDQRLGDVLASLKKHGFEDNTLFVYSSDHGPEWPRSKWTTYDAGLRVPLIARWPGRIRAGSVTGAMISFVDVTPTFVDVAGGRAPENLDGRSFKPVLLGRASAFRDEIYATHSRDKDKNLCPQRAIRDLRYKYILNLHPERRWTSHFTLVPDIPGSHKAVYDTWTERAKSDAASARLMDLIERHPREELYDTEADPHELLNLTNDPAARSVLERMRDRLKQVRGRLGDVDE